MPEFTLTQLVLITALTVCFFSLTIGGLSYYYYRTGKKYLQFGAIAVGFACAGNLTALFAQPLFDQPFYAAQAGTSILLPLSAVLMTGYAVFMYSAVCSLVARGVSSRLIVGAVMVVIVAAGLQGLGLLEDAVGLLAELPTLVLLAMTCLYLSRETWTAARIVLAVLLVVHAGCRVLLGLSPGDDAVNLLLIDGISQLLAGGMLPVILAEQMIVSLEARHQELERYAQENRRLELQFNQAQKHESLGVMAGGIAHDFNNMLTSIIGYTSMAMKKLPADSEARKDLYMAMSGARQAVELTSQMLVYAGKGATDFELLDISRVVDNLSSLINSIVPPRIRLVRKIPADLPLVRGDAVQLGQVVMNLVANSVDALQNRIGTIELKTGLADVSSSVLEQGVFAAEHEPGAFVFIEVADTGVGIAAGELEKIFDPFYSDKTRKRGMGLSSISGIVRQHRGFLRVTSTPGQGSTFTAYFPLVSYRDQTRLPGSRSNGAQPRVKGRVLIADDDSRIRSLIVSILESDAYRPIAVENGREAVNLIESEGHDYDAFVLDCTMPKVSGMEVYRELRARGLGAPVILISGYHEEQAIENISRDDNAYFVKKPFSIDEMLEIVNAALKRKATRSKHV